MAGRRLAGRNEVARNNWGNKAGTQCQNVGNDQQDGEHCSGRAGQIANGVTGELAADAIGCCLAGVMLVAGRGQQLQRKDNHAQACHYPAQIATGQTTGLR